MDPETHSFPLPDAESAKLSVFAQESSNQPHPLTLMNVRANPWQSILCAFGFGVLLSLLFRHWPIK